MKLTGRGIHASVFSSHCQTAGSRVLPDDKPATEAKPEPSLPFGGAIDILQRTLSVLHTCIRYRTNTHLYVNMYDKTPSNQSIAATYSSRFLSPVFTVWVAPTLFPAVLVSAVRCLFYPPSLPLSLRPPVHFSATLLSQRFSSSVQNILNLRSEKKYTQLKVYILLFLISILFKGTIFNPSINKSPTTKSQNIPLKPLDIISVFVDLVVTASVF